MTADIRDTHPRLVLALLDSAPPKALMADALRDALIIADVAREFGATDERRVPGPVDVLVDEDGSVEIVDDSDVSFTADPVPEWDRLKVPENYPQTWLEHAQQVVPGTFVRLPVIADDGMFHAVMCNRPVAGSSDRELVFDDSSRMVVERHQSLRATRESSADAWRRFVCAADDRGDVIGALFAMEARQ